MKGTLLGNLHIFNFSAANWPKKNEAEVY